jgi:hypothetical protein
MGIIDGELQCRSKGKQIDLNNPEKMFAAAVGVVKSLDLVPGWIYRCEYLQKPHHNTLAYERIPAKHLVLFDVETEIQTFLSETAKIAEAIKLGLEPIPVIYEGLLGDAVELNKLLETDSVLGGTTVEGIVVKNYDMWTLEKKIAIGKYVSERFKEKHGESWKARNPTTGDFIGDLIATYRTEPRWKKAVQHLKENGQLDGSPKDIGPLIREVAEDIIKEEAEAIKQILFSRFWKQIHRGVTAGLPEWYKQELASAAFAGGSND